MGDWNTLHTISTNFLGKCKNPLANQINREYRLICWGLSHIPTWALNNMQVLCFILLYSNRKEAGHCLVSFIFQRNVTKNIFIWKTDYVNRSYKNDRTRYTAKLPSVLTVWDQLLSLDIPWSSSIIINTTWFSKERRGKAFVFDRFAALNLRSQWWALI